MSEIDERLMDLVKRRSNLPASIAVMETHTYAQRINACLADLESNAMRLAACWDGELDPIGAFSQLSYLHEKVGRGGCCTVAEQGDREDQRLGPAGASRVTLIVGPRLRDLSDEL